MNPLGLAAPNAADTRRRWRPRRDHLRSALALLWILDAALQWQPAMFGRDMVTGMLLPAAHGQPAPLAWSITALAHVVRPDVAVWNLLFGAVQLAIGIGMLVPRTRQAAMRAMLVWVVGVWWFGEGFGQVLVGASPLAGAPGAALLYGALDLALWPTAAEAAGWRARRWRGDHGFDWLGLADRLSGRRDQTAAGAMGADGAMGAGGAGRSGGSGAVPAAVASSASGVGRWPAAGLVAWSAWWVVSAFLWLLPAQRRPGAVAGQLVAMAGGQPHGYTAFLTRVGHDLASVGPQTAWLLAAASLVVGLGPLVARRPTRFLVAGALLATAFWVTGEGLGGVLTGMGTDPNAGPLVVLLAAALLPACVPVRLDTPSPARRLARMHPGLVTAAMGSLGMALLLGATYPANAPARATAVASTDATAAMAGMPGMGGASGTGIPTAGGRGRAGGRHAVAAGSPHAAGRAPTWHYTGPVLPTFEVSQLRTVFRDTELGHQMQTPDCTTAPTAAQQQAALTLVQQTSAAVARYRQLSTALAAGYVPITDPSYPVVHYVDPAYLRSGDVLDPLHVQSLVYAFTPYGPVLAAAMYLMPAAGEPGPMPGGCLTLWHTHTNLCASASGIITGFTPCAPGLHPARIPEMMHVWQVPVPGGSLAMDPTDLQVVEASIMAQRAGLAPMPYPAGNAPGGAAYRPAGRSA